MKKEKLKKEVRFYPPYDKRETGYGICAMRCFMILKGSYGAITFNFHTGIYTKEVHEELIRNNAHNPEMLLTITRAMGADVSGHSYEPVDEYTAKEGPSKKCCEWLDGKPCYIGSSSALLADEMFKIMIKEGDEAVWEKMEEYYYDWLKPYKKQ